MGEYDVVVVGGGTAGFAAGVSASEHGLSTLIVEENAYLGGTCTGAAISQLMGFADGEVSSPITGIVGRVLDELTKRNASNGIETIYLSGDKNLAVPVIPYDSEEMKCVMADMVMSSGCDVLLHTRAIAAECHDGSIDSIVIHNEEGIQRVKAKVFIDASFHASLSKDAGVKTVVGDENGVMQPGTLMFKMGNADIDAFKAFPVPERKALAKKGIEEGRMYVANLLARPLPNGLAYLNMSRIKANPMDTLTWGKAEIEARRQVKRISSFFVENVPGFKDAKLCETGAFLGLRDSRRIVGKYVLKDSDVLEGTVFEDKVAISSYPIDIHDANGHGSIVKKPLKGSFSIPYRSMVTNEVRNLIVAGRCISTEPGAHASIRVMVTCIRLGEAAGIASSLSITEKEDANTLDGRKVSKEIFK